VEFSTDGFNNIYFNSSASEIDKLNIINIIRSDPNFFKEFDVITKYKETNYGKNLFLGTTDNIMVQFKDPYITSADINDFMNEYSLSLVWGPEPELPLGYSYTYLFKNEMETGSRSGSSTIFKAIDIYDNSDDIVQYVFPDVRGVKSSSSDTYYNNLWHLHNNAGGSCASGSSYPAYPSAKIDSAWNMFDSLHLGASYSGAGILIANSDLEGFQWQGHPDIETQFINGWDLTTNDTLRGNKIRNYTSYDGHGNATSGILAAKGNNNEGVIGVAYNATIYPIYNTSEVSDMCRTIRRAVLGNADVINISQGAPGLSISTCRGDVSYAVTDGRGSKGCVIVAGAGNKSKDEVTYPASDYRYVLSVSATTPEDKLKVVSDIYSKGTAWGSNYNALVSAPGACITTTDFKADSGYSITDYETMFEGTSAASPIVAGLAALLLEKNPSLTYKEVYWAIMNGAEKVGGYDYTDVPYEYGRSNELGYGRVNGYNTLFNTNTTDYTSVLHYNSIPLNIHYNNPVTKDLILNINEYGSFVLKIYSINGTCVLTKEIKLTDIYTATIDISFLENGLYIMNILNKENNKYGIAKFVKQ
jgi:subtilisin family serine protease